MNTPVNRPKKLIVINDMSGFGRCSMTVALPVISACGVQAIPVPTSIFSNHTGFSSWYKYDLTDSMTDYLTQLTRLSIDYDGIYCGYFGSLSQIQIVRNYIQTEKKSRPIKLILDPVMGDHGMCYSSITSEFCLELKALLPYADLITPNITEACLLTDTPYKEDSFTEEELLTMCQKLQALGATNIIITGLNYQTHIQNFCYESAHHYSLLSNERAGASRPGTGDLFASIVSAMLLRNHPLSDCVKKASGFISTCIHASDEANVPINEGVIFESFLKELIP